MRIHFVDHAGFQRAALVAIGVGGGLTLVAALAAFPPAVALAGLGAVLAAGILRPGRPWGPGRRALAAAGSAGALVLAHQTAEAILPYWFAASAAEVTDVAAGVVMGLVASAGLVPLHLELRLADPAAVALARIEARLGPEERTLCRRAVAAEEQIASALATDHLPDARALRRLTRAATLDALALAERARPPADDEPARAERAAALEALIASLRHDESAAPDEGSRAEYRRAIGALLEQQQQVAAIAGARTRLRAHLHGQVALLEGTALALAARRDAVAVDAAVSLAPLVERLRDVSAQAHAEATALVELGGALTAAPTPAPSPGQLPSPVALEAAPEGAPGRSPATS